MTEELMASGLWLWLQNRGLERFELARQAKAWILRGTILTQAGSGAAEARYEITCDGGFTTRGVKVSLRQSQGERFLQIDAEQGRWYVNGREEAGVRGAVDVDLGWSPATNTLPIRRLELGVGERSGEFIAAWVRFPELTVEPLSQEYQRVSPSLYRYRSQGGGFTADLTVDAQGLVIDYQGFWQRVAGP